MPHRLHVRVASLLAVTWVIVALAAAASFAQKKVPPAAPIELNAATIEQLEQIPGIGPATAKSIVRMREKSGRFRRVEDLLAVHGVSPARFEKIKPYVYVAAPKS